MLLFFKAWRAELLAAIACLSATACATTEAPPLSTSIVAAGPVAAPSGFLDLCLEQPEACGAETALPIRPQVEMNDELWAQVNRMNRDANRAIRYVSDANFGRPDVWRIATNAGDCEDYALAKRAAMMDVGFPATALRLATVYSRRTGHHAVLVLTTTDGDYVLDNTRDVILPWEQTQFAWVSVQSSGDPMQWLRVASRTGGMADVTVEATAGG
jgi:predicted transglutaminase-like cysteine proteinase